MQQQEPKQDEREERIQYALRQLFVLIQEELDADETLYGIEPTLYERKEL